MQLATAPGNLSAVAALRPVNPFIYDRVLRNGWSRMDNSVGVERSFALMEIAKISNHRFDELISDANPILSTRFGRFDEMPW